MRTASKDLQDKFKELSKIKYYAVTIPGKCKSCGTCVKFCPLKIRIFNTNGTATTIKTNKSCGGCSVCFKRCPAQAIELVAMEKKADFNNF